MPIYDTGNWTEYLKAIKSAVPLNSDEKLILILSDDWVYEGFADEMFKVLNKTDIWIDDFYCIKKI